MNEEIFFTQLIRPTTMRSQYWKYFGFPADNDGKIVTRKKIFCTICNTAIAYNQNTTNLKAHLQSRHDEELSTLDQTPAKKTKLTYLPSTPNLETSDISYFVDGGLSHLDQQQQRNDEQQVKLPGTNVDNNSAHHDMIALKMFKASSSVEPQESNESDIDDKKVILVIDTSDIEGDEAMSTELSYSMNTSTDHNDLLEEVIYRSDSPVDDISFGSREQNDDESAEALMQLIVETGIPTEMIEGHAFQRFCSTLNRNFAVPTAASIELQMFSRFKQDRSEAHSALLSNLHDTCSYAFGFDHWTNCSNKSFISISIFYNMDNSSTGTIQCDNVQTLEATLTSDWSLILSDFNLHDCTVAIVNFQITDIESLHALLQANDTPVIGCYGYLIERAVQRCLMLPIVADAFKHVVELLDTDDQEQPQHPVVHERFWMTKLQLLEHFSDYCERHALLSSPEAVELHTNVKSIIKSVRTLKIAMDTIAREKLSLVWPVTNKMIQNHFTCQPSDSPIEVEIKEAMHSELSSSLTPESFYLVASFLDPRFQCLTEPCDMPTIKSELSRLSGSYNQTESLRTNTVQRSDVKSTALSCDLSYFFGNNVNDALAMRKSSRRCRLDVEIDNYLTDVDVKLGVCPFEWWSGPDGMFYPKLRQLAQRHRCAPPIMPIHRLSLNEQILQHNKRFMLTGSARYINMMVWLASKSM